MNTLLKRFEGRLDTVGWFFRQIRRNGEFAIYERSRGDEVTYEVIRIPQYGSDKRVDGRFLARKGDEYYPRPSQWGIYAWSLRTREAAEEKYNQLTKDWQSRSLRSKISDAHCVDAASPY